jgi:hypothetical protein
MIMETVFTSLVQEEGELRVSSEEECQEGCTVFLVGSLLSALLHAC